jgi:hypothetical protein
MASSSTTYAYAFGDSSVTTVQAITAAGFAFTDAQLKKADVALISIDGTTARFTYDGTTPTTAIGHYVANGATFIVRGQQNIEKLQFIATTGTAYVAITLESYSPDGI